MLNWVGMGADVVRVGDSVQTPRDSDAGASAAAGRDRRAGRARDLKKDYATKAALWGWASHPLVDGDRLVCVVGTDVAHAAAFDLKTGKEV